MVADGTGSAQHQSSMIERPRDREFTVRSLFVLTVAVAGVLLAVSWMKPLDQLAAAIPWILVAVLLVVTYGDVIISVIAGAASVGVMMLFWSLLTGDATEMDYGNGVFITFATGWCASLAGSTNAVVRGYVFVGGCILFVCLTPCCLAAIVAG